MTDYTDFEEEQLRGQGKTPVFLKVLCILTFVSCGLTFLSTIWGLTAGDNLRESMQIMQRSSTGTALDSMADGMAANIANLEKWQNLAHYLNLACVALTLAGALLMWKLKKNGFYLYVLGQVAAIVGSVGMVTAMQDVPFMGTFGMIGAIFGILFIVAFIIMYAVNLKHMR